MDASVVIPALLIGTGYTLAIFVGAAVLGVVVSVIVGLCRMSRLRLIGWPAQVYIEIFRGTSAFVQLFWLYYALPLLTGIYLPALPVAILAVGLNTSAYGAEIVRSTLTAVPKGQHEAARALGLTPGHRMWHIIFPQAIPAMIPPFGNLLIEALKNSALAAMVSVPELLYQARYNLGTQYPSERLPLFLISLAIYFVLAQGITALTRLGERRAGRGMRPQAGVAHA